MWVTVMIKAEAQLDSFSGLYGLFYYFKKSLLSVLWTFEEGTRMPVQSLPIKFKWSSFFHSFFFPSSVFRMTLLNSGIYLPYSFMNGCCRENPSSRL